MNINKGKNKVVEVNKHVLFPTLIWEIDLFKKKNMLLEMKRFILKTKNADPIGIRRSNYGGWHSKIYNIYVEEFYEFEKIMNDVILGITNELDVPTLELSEYWFNVNEYGDYNELHNHHGSYLSGVFYISVPDKNMGNIHFHRGDNMKFLLHKLERPNNITGQEINYESKTGKLLIFPGWLDHNVDGSRSKDKRISISFNYRLKN